MVEVGTSSMTPEERKRFENVTPRRGRGGYGGYYTDHGGGYGRGAPRPKEGGMDRAMAQFIHKAATDRPGECVTTVKGQGTSQSNALTPSR